MKFKTLLSLAALALPFGAAAVPAYPGIMQKQNPDGSVVKYRILGDENFSYMTDADMTCFMSLATDGSLVPMRRNGAVLAYSEQNAKMLASEAEITSDMRRKRTMAPLDENGQTTFPTEGEWRSLLILLEFSDTKFAPKEGYDNARDFYDDWANKNGFEYLDQKGSARDYYEACSRGIFHPSWEVPPVVTLPQPASYYVGTDVQGSSAKYYRFGEAMEYALKHLDETMDFTKFDTDGDGVIDNIFFMYAGYGQADTQVGLPYIWPHSGSVTVRNETTGRYEYVYVDGIRAGLFACAAELRGASHWMNKDLVPNGIGTFSHEFGHVLGLPDLYDPAYVNNCTVPGDWSVMCGGPYNMDSTRPPYYSGYEAWLCKWMEPENVEDGTHYTVKPLDDENPGLYKIRILRRNRDDYYLPDEYYLVEYRNQKGWDAGHPKPAMLIWHIAYDAGKWSNNNVNSDFNKPLCTLVTASEAPNLRAGNSQYWMESFWPYVTNRGTVIDYIAPGTPNELIPFSNFYNRDLFRPYLTSMKINEEEDVAEFDYNVITETPSAKAEFESAGRIEGENKVILKWKPVEGAKSYQLSVSRKSATTGATYAVDNLTNTDIGNVTEYLVQNISNLAMTQEFTCTLRAIFDLPSSELSEPLVFIPEQLPNDQVGIDGVEADNAVIYGAEGCIVAPEEAQVFTIHGIRVGMENLPAGVYIVRYGRIVRKVVVK